MKVSIITPWFHHGEFLTGYESTVAGAETIVVSNGNPPELTDALAAMIDRLGNGSRLIRNETNNYFSPANNQGLAVATGDVIVFLNNDVIGEPGWIDKMLADIRPNMLAGPSVAAQVVDGMICPYVEGWCVAATRETWDKIGGWDAEGFPLPYYEDTWLSFHARTLGCEIRKATWPIKHLGGNTTSSTHPEIMRGAEVNRETYFARVRAWRQANLGR